MALMDTYYGSGKKSVVGLDKLYAVECLIEELGDLTADTHGFKLCSLPANTHVLGIFIDGETRTATTNFRIGEDSLDDASFMADTDMKDASIPLFKLGVTGNLTTDEVDVVITAKTTADLTGGWMKVTLLCLTV